jgi:hypothetical protein
MGLILTFETIGQTPFLYQDNDEVPVWWLVPLGHKIFSCTLFEVHQFNVFEF